MVNADEALRIARDYLQSSFPGIDLVVTNVVEREVGWGIVYQHRRFLETGDPNDALLGPGPLLIRRDDGSVVELGTFQPLEDELRDYADSRGNSA